MGACGIERGRTLSNGDVFTITLADLEETAEEFGRIVVDLPQHGMIIVMDDQIWGNGWIKQFPRTPYGMVRAQRWAVRLEDVDETSKQPFKELCAEHLADIEVPGQKQPYKITAVVNISPEDRAHLTGLGCSDRPYITRETYLAFRVDIEREKLSELAKIPCVLSVEPMPTYKPAGGYHGR